MGACAKPGSSCLTVAPLFFVTNIHWIPLAMMSNALRGPVAAAVFLSLAFLAGPAAAADAVVAPQPLEVWGIPVDFVLFPMTLLGVAYSTTTLCRWR
jgi:hypothetical protein